MGVGTITKDVCIVGGGSAGIGAAFAAARNGASVVVVERFAQLGGTSTNALVCNWPREQSNPLSEELITPLLKNGRAIFLGLDKAAKPPVWRKSDKYTYADTIGCGAATFEEPSLCDAATTKVSIQFSPKDYAAYVYKQLSGNVNAQVMFDTEMTGVHCDPSGKVQNIMAVSSGNRSSQINATTFIDCSGDMVLARGAGCTIMQGMEAQSVFGEPSAPQNGNAGMLNTATLCYVVWPDKMTIKGMKVPAPRGNGASAPLPPTQICMTPDGGYIINSLQMFSGPVKVIGLVHQAERNYADAWKTASQAAALHWKAMQDNYPEWCKNLTPYIDTAHVPMIGIRESYRVKGQYVLKQQDCLKWSADPGSRDASLNYIASACHPFDLLAGGPTIDRKYQLTGKPYGVPFECLLPAGPCNLLVAGRGASFSHIAASSCRIERPMMALGVAAGTAAALAKTTGVCVAGINRAELVEKLGHPW